MGLDPTRTNPIYTPPQQPQNYGTPAPVSYGIPQGPGGTPNLAKTPTVYKNNTGGGFTAPPPATPPASAPPPATGTDAPLAGPGYGEDWYKTYGNDLMNTPSASEKLFAEGDAGSNPFYDFAQQQAVKGLNDASAARGDFNSSFTLKNIGSAIADIRGQQAHELGQLASQADQGKFGRYDRGNQYSSDAQRLMENRANKSLDYQMDLSKGESGLVNGYYGEAGREATASQMAQIEANLKKAGLSEAEYDKWMKILFEGVGSGAKLGA